MDLKDIKAIVEAMTASGCSAEQIASTCVHLSATANDHRKAAAARRQAAYRARQRGAVTSRDVTEHNVTQDEIIAQGGNISHAEIAEHKANNSRFARVDDDLSHAEIAYVEQEVTKSDVTERYVTSRDVTERPSEDETGSGIAIARSGTRAREDKCLYNYIYNNYINGLKIDSNTDTHLQVESYSETEKIGKDSNYPPNISSLRSEILIPPQCANPLEKPKNSGKSPEKQSPRQILETVLSPETAQDVIDHRKAKRSPLTPRAAKLLANAFAESGDPEEAAATMILRGWQGFKAEWLASTKPRAGPGPAGKSSGTIEAMQAFWERHSDAAQRERERSSNSSASDAVQLLQLDWRGG